MFYHGCSKNRVKIELKNIIYPAIFRLPFLSASLSYSSFCLPLLLCFPSSSPLPGSRVFAAALHRLPPPSPLPSSPPNSLACRLCYRDQERERGESTPPKQASAAASPPPFSASVFDRLSLRSPSSVALRPPPSSRSGAIAGAATSTSPPLQSTPDLRRVRTPRPLHYATPPIDKGGTDSKSSPPLLPPKSPSPSPFLAAATNRWLPSTPTVASRPTGSLCFDI